MLTKFILKNLPYNDRIHFHTSYRLRIITTIFCILSLFSILYYNLFSSTELTSKLSISVFGLLTLFLLCLERLSFTPCFLLSTFTMITIWRLSVLENWIVSEYIFALTAILIILNFLIAAYKDLLASKKHFPGKHNSGYEWQLLFIRMYLGYDLIPHFSEKLFAGSVIRSNDVTAFTSLGMQHSLLFVIIAGLIEFFGGLGISCGFLTRLSAITLFLYLIIATLLGHHFNNGFIWANTGGGWEYPLLWSILILSFFIFGAGRFSIDETLKERLRLPGWIKILMG